MNAATLRSAADTVTETVSSVTDTVTERLGDRLGDLGGAAQRLAAITPWVEPPRRGNPMTKWFVRLAVVAAIGALGWWFVNRKSGGASPYQPPADQGTANASGRKLAAAGG